MARPITGNHGQRVGINVTKLDAAKRQLATAIHLYFEDLRCCVGTYASMAAGEIIDQLCKSKGLPTLREHFLAAIIPERRKEVGVLLNKARNFFKHASSAKPNEVLDFSDDQNLFAIIMAGLPKQPRAVQKEFGRELLYVARISVT